MKQIINRINHTSWEAIATPTDRPKSVRNRCVIEVFGGVFVLSRCFLDFCQCIGFRHISFFFLYKFAGVLIPRRGIRTIHSLKLVM